MNIQKFNENEIPYEALSRCGLSQEMVDDLPQSVMERFLAGKRTPLLSTSVKDNNGNPMKTSIYLRREENGAVNVVFVPYLNYMDFKDFNDEQQKRLMKGNVLLAELQGREKAYYQLDESTNQIMQAPAALIQNNIGVLAKETGLDVSMEKGIGDGEIITAFSGDKAVTYGIDLKEDYCIRMIDGTKEMWEREENKDELPQYSFGLYGCWTFDKDDGLSYVPEGEYSEDMVKAQQDRIEQAKTRAMHM